jgi:hypothetical protein
MNRGYLRHSVFLDNLFNIINYNTNVPVFQNPVLINGRDEN